MNYFRLGETSELKMRGRILKLAIKINGEKGTIARIFGSLQG